ncbi:RNA polymerase sigma factor [Acetatifactor aquisgranensis]|uniref:RNA polymerase sigma factor n=1 Tax=Acetatifactor aquisgranensis TaxID=2941233 RepID=UPI00203D951C|nr:sigma-70 family RNA polymerase sigma factor [Acetatifactor aquisgranensis]
MEELYRQYSQIVFHFLYKRCNDPALAEDLMQEAFLKALERLDSYDHSCKLSTWLCQIAKHLLYQHWDKSRRVQLEELDESMQSRQDTEQTAMAKVELADVWDRLQALSPDARKTVELRVLGDLSFREIGDLLGKTENWARVTFYRAKLTLIQDS